MIYNISLYVIDTSDLLVKRLYCVSGHQLVWTDHPSDKPLGDRDQCPLVH